VLHEPQKVWYFDNPTIGYCPKCDCIALWDNVRGLHCPRCKAKKLSLFIWDKKSEPPE
jgi:hypothetical protein